MKATKKVQMEDFDEGKAHHAATAKAQYGKQQKNNKLPVIKCGKDGCEGGAGRLVGDAGRHLLLRYPS